MQAGPGKFSNISEHTCTLVDRETTASKQIKFVENSPLPEISGSHG